jgi:hypothetical protein
MRHDERRLPSILVSEREEVEMGPEVCGLVVVIDTFGEFGAGGVQ